MGTKSESSSSQNEPERTRFTWTNVRVWPFETHYSSWSVRTSLFQRRTLPCHEVCSFVILFVFVLISCDLMMTLCSAFSYLPVSPLPYPPRQDIDKAKQKKTVVSRPLGQCFVWNESTHFCLLDWFKICVFHCSGESDPMYVDFKVSKWFVEHSP